MAETVMAVVIGTLFAFGTFLLLRQDIVRVIWGTIILSQAANVYLITMGGIGGDIPVVSGHGGGHAESAAVTDPLVQALVLTAIVIGFGTTAFILVLMYRVYEEYGTINLDTIVTGGTQLADSPGSSGTRHCMPPERNQAAEVQQP